MSSFEVLLAGPLLKRPKGSQREGGKPQKRHFMLKRMPSNGQTYLEYYTSAKMVGKPKGVIAGSDIVSVAVRDPSHFLTVGSVVATVRYGAGKIRYWGPNQDRSRGGTIVALELEAPRGDESDAATRDYFTGAPPRHTALVHPHEIILWDDYLQRIQGAAPLRACWQFRVQMARRTDGHSRTSLDIVAGTFTEMQEWIFGIWGSVRGLPPALETQLADTVPGALPSVAGVPRFGTDGIDQGIGGGDGSVSGGGSDILGGGGVDGSSNNSSNNSTLKGTRHAYDKLHQPTAYGTLKKAPPLADASSSTTTAEANLQSDIPLGAPWFHTDTGRPGAEAKLMTHGQQPGLFLVRASRDGKNRVISVVQNDRALEHYIVSTSVLPNGTKAYSLGEHMLPVASFEALLTYLGSANPTIGWHTGLKHFVPNM